MPRDPTRAEVLQDALLDSMRRNRDPIKAANERTAPIMPSNDKDIEIALLKQALENMRADLSDVRTQLDGMLKDRERAMRWGVTVLGSAVVTMAGYIFNLFSGKHP